MEESDSDVIQRNVVVMDELGDELENGFGADDNSVFEESADVYELETASDDGTDPDEILDMAFHHVAAKKRSQRSFSYEHGFDFPSVVRKEIVSNKKKQRKKKRGKQDLLIKQSAKLKEDRRDKPIRKEKKLSRFNRVIKPSESNDASLLGKRTATDICQTELGLSKRSRNQTPVVSQSDSVPQNHSEIVKQDDNSPQWNVRQNSFSDLLLKHFNVISQSNNIIKMTCKLCGEGKRPISSVVGNNSNMKRHMKSVRTFCFLFEFNFF